MQKRPANIEFQPKPASHRWPELLLPGLQYGGHPQGETEQAGEGTEQELEVAVAAGMVAGEMGDDK